MSSEEREAVTSLREDWFARQKEFLASLHARYPYLPWVLRAIRTLDADTLLHQETWRNRHDRTKNDLVELKRLHGRSLDYAGWRSLEVSNRQWGAGPIARHASRSTRRPRPGVGRGAPASVPAVRAARGPLAQGPPVPGGVLLILRRQGPAAHDLQGRGGRARGARRRGVLAGTSWPGARMATSQPLPPLDEDVEIDLEEPA